MSGYTIQNNEKEEYKKAKEDNRLYYVAEKNLFYCDSIKDPHRDYYHRGENYNPSIESKAFSSEAKQNEKLYEWLLNEESIKRCIENDGFEQIWVPVFTKTTYSINNEPTIENKFIAFTNFKKFQKKAYFRKYLKIGFGTSHIIHEMTKVIFAKFKSDYLNDDEEINAYIAADIIYETLKSYLYWSDSEEGKAFVRLDSDEESEESDKVLVEELRFYKRVKFEYPGGKVKLLELVKKYWGILSANSGEYLTEFNPKKLSQIQVNPDPVKFVKALDLLGLRQIDIAYQKTAIIGFQTYINNIRNVLGDPKAVYTPKALYFYGTGGSGKDYLTQRLGRFADSIGWSHTRISDIDPIWTGPKYSSNIMVFCTEKMPRNKRDSAAYIEAVNPIIDHSKYTCRMKYQDDVDIESIANIIFCSNYTPSDPNSTRYTIIHFNSECYRGITLNKTQKELLNDGKPIEYWNKIIEDLFESCPYTTDFNYEFVRSYSPKVENPDVIMVLKDLAEKVKDTPDEESAKEYTIYQIGKLYEKYKPTSQYSTMEFKQCLKKLIVELNDNKLIRGSKNSTNPDPIYKKYDLFELAKIETNYDLNPDIIKKLLDGKNFNSQLEASSYVSAKIISQVENYCKENNIRLGSEYTQQEKIDELFHMERMPNCINYTDKGSIIPRDNSEFILTAQYLPGKESCGDRKGENMVPTMLLYESDNLPLKEQVKIAERVKDGPYKNNIISITHSGNKSIHFCVYIGKNDRMVAKEKIKKVWKEIGLKIFGSDISNFDQSCATVGRLTRYPGHKRSDNGQLQEVLYFNSKPIGFDFNLISQEISSNYRDVDKIISSIKQPKSKTKPIKILTFEDELEKLVNTKEKYDDDKNHKREIAIKLATGELVDSGEDLFGVINYLKTAKYGPLLQVCLEEAAKQHPSNISPKSKFYRELIQK